MKKFIFGILFSYLILPFVQCLSSLISNETQLLNHKIARKTYKIKKEMGILQQENIDPIATQAIGFTIEDPEQYEQEEEDE